jgi:ABC-type transporter Mla subunit MlaD
MPTRVSPLALASLSLLGLIGCTEIAAQLGGGSSHVVVDDAHGIAIGNQVRVHGVNVGRVTEVGLEPEGARIAFEISARDALHPDACGSVRRDGLAGEAYLHIEAGTAEGEWEGPLRACETPGVDATIALTAGLLEDLRSYVGSLERGERALCTVSTPSAAPPTTPPAPVPTSTLEPTADVPDAGAASGEDGLVDPWN